MKFTDGHWMMRAGVTPTYAVEVLDVATTADGMRILRASGWVPRSRDGESLEREQTGRQVRNGRRTSYPTRHWRAHRVW